MKRQGWLALFPVVCVIGALVTLQFLPVVEWITALQQWMLTLGAPGVALYALAFGLCGVLLLPGGILGAGSGLLFGLWGGFLVILAGNILGAAGALLLGRFLFRGWIEKKMLSNPRWAALDKAIDREGWKIVLLSQLHPLFPTSLLNYFYGITRIRFWPCLFWVTVGKSPGLLLYVYLGTLGQRGIDLARESRTPTFAEYALWGGGLAAILLLTWLLGRLAFRLLKEFHGENSRAIS